MVYERLLPVRAPLELSAGLTRLAWSENSGTCGWSAGDAGRDAVAVIDAAQTLQQALAPALGKVGPWRLAVAVTLLTGIPMAVAAARGRRRACASDPPAATTSPSVPEVSSD
jgi:hypothetical protein